MGYVVKLFSKKIKANNAINDRSYYWIYVQGVAHKTAVLIKTN